MNRRIMTLVCAVALTFACTEPTPMDAAVGTYALVALYPTRMPLPATVHIESSRTAIRNFLDIYADTLELGAGGTWEERSIWRFTDNENSPHVTFYADTGRGTFARDDQNRLVLTATGGGFLTTIQLPIPAPTVAESDTLMIPLVSSQVTWDPRFIRVP